MSARRPITPARLAVVAILAVLAALIVIAEVLWHRSPPIRPRSTSMVTDRNGTSLAQLGNDGEGYGYWPVEHVPDRVAAALPVLGDRRFRVHPGVDPLAIVPAPVGN